MSFLLLALVEANEGDVRGAVERVMEPYHSLNGPVQKCRLLPADVLHVAVRFNLPLYNHPDLAARLSECQQWPCGVDEKGLFVERPFNPRGKWQKRVIGGEWDGRLIGEPYDVGRAGIDGTVERNCIPVSDIPTALRDHSVHNLLTPTGRWYDDREIRQSFAHSMRFCPTCRTVSRCHDGWWNFLVKSLLAEYSSCLAVAVSCRDWEFDL
jgi:hypothetical protein